MIEATENSNNSPANMQETKDVSLTSTRQTVSYLESINVEDQIVQVFCEQVCAASGGCLVSQSAETDFS